MGLRLPVRRERQLSAGNRVALTLTLAVAVAALVLVAVSYWIFSRQLMGDLDRALASQVDGYVAAVKTARMQGPEEFGQASRTYLLSPRSGSSAVFMLRLENGQILQSASTGLPGPRPFTAASVVVSPTLPESVRAAAGEEYRVLTTVIRDTSNRPMAVLQTALPTASVRRTARDVVLALLAAAVLLVAGGALLSRRVASEALKPLHDAAVTAARVTHDSLSERVLYEGPPDDVGVLVNSFNAMLSRLEDAFAQQRRFIADASHEMRTPLTIMQGHLEVMRVEGGLTTDQESTLELVMDELERTTRMVTGLLSLARLEGGTQPVFRELDLGEVVEEAVTRGQGLGRRRISFSHGGRLPVRGNRDLLLEALLNLLSNAVSHTAEDGRIAVDCRALDGRASIEVRDDGPGIPVEDLDRIFDRFYRSPSRPRPGGGGGSGLGLAIARRLVELHGGTLTAKNGQSGGAVFAVRIPLLSIPRVQ